MTSPLNNDNPTSALVAVPRDELLKVRNEAISIRAQLSSARSREDKILTKMETLEDHTFRLVMKQKNHKNTARAQKEKAETLGRILRGDPELLKALSTSELKSLKTTLADTLTKIEEEVNKRQF